MGHGCGARYDNTHRGFVAHAQKYGLVVLVMLGIWALTGFAGAWPFWVAGIMAFKLAAHARAVYGGRGWGGGDGEGGGESGAAPDPEDDFVIV